MTSAFSVITGPFRSFGSWYLKSAQQHPFATAFWTSGIKTSAADLIAQKVVEKREELDWSRHLGFVAFGFLYLGSVQYYLYNVKFVQWCGGITAQVGHAGVAPLKTLMDQGIHHPFMYFPVFFLTQSLVAQKPHPIEYAANKWKNEVWESCKALWMLWVPGQIINFAVVPRYLRVPFAAGISFAWSLWCILASFTTTTQPTHK
ncbi:hypothetical protein WJX73_004317 [Symbiochloris irregularis]|uniref:Uncharacterized protein n=1 Tax=Symbiochloris irregularis TaxID=706552 RepID=A0AAW1NLV7_9CHLO